MKNMLNKLYQNNKDIIQDGIAGAVSAITLYTPPFAIIELCSGYNIWETMTSRTAGVVVQAGMGIAMQANRRRKAKKGKLYNDQTSRKISADLVFVGLTQPFIYAGILGLNALAHHHSLTQYKEILYRAIPPGLAVATLTTPFFGKLVDNFWRKKIFGIAPTYKERSADPELTLNESQQDRLNVISNNSLESLIGK